MDDTGKTAPKKRKHSFSVKALSSVIPQQMRKKPNVLPCVSSFPTSCLHGYLWRLSGRRVLANPSWKTKYFVLHEDRLYYYASVKGQAGGVIELKNFVDCLEAPLSDHKKASNAFFLVAEERGFFDQGRYYLSAETLSEMMGWVAGIRQAIENIKGRQIEEENKKDNFNKSRESNQDSMYSSIREDSIQRANSVTTLHSTSQDQTGLKNPNIQSWQNRSMDCGPLLGLGEDEHNLTYSYSSEEEGLNTSLPVNFGQISPRSADTSLRRQVFKREAQFKSLDEKSTTGTHRENTYLSFEDLLYMDANNYGSASKSPQNTLSSIDDINESPKDYKRLVKMVQDVKKQSDSISQMFRRLDNESWTDRQDTGPMHFSVQATESRVDSMEDRLGGLQSVMTRLETQATDLMLEIRATHCRAMQSISDAEKARRDYQDMKERTEQVLFQLQRETAASKHPSIKDESTSESNESYSLYTADWAQTFPKQKPVTLVTSYLPQSILRGTNGSDNSLTRRTRNQQASVKICQDPSHVNSVSALPATSELQALHLSNDNREDDEMYEAYTKPQYKEPFKIETYNQRCLRRRSLRNSGFFKQNLENQRHRNSQFDEEETGDNSKEPKN